MNNNNPGRRIAIVSIVGYCWSFRGAGWWIAHEAFSAASIHPFICMYAVGGFSLISRLSQHTHSSLLSLMKTRCCRCRKNGLFGRAGSLLFSGRTHFLIIWSAGQRAHTWLYKFAGTKHPLSLLLYRRSVCDERADCWGFCYATNQLKVDFLLGTITSVLFLANRL